MTKHVLVEHPDGAVRDAMARALSGAGYDVSVCEGPDAFRRGRCPLVATGRCAMAEEADVIVCGLDVDVPSTRQVLAAQRLHLAGTPVLVDVNPLRADRHGPMLAGARRLPFPVTRRSLVETIDETVGGP